MPKISKNIYRIDGVLHSLETWYNTKIHFYIKNPPVKVVALGEFHNSGHESEAALRIAFKDSLDKYHELSKKTRKVIHVNVYLGRLMEWKKTGRGSFKRMEARTNLQTLKAEHGLGLDYEIMFRVDSDKTRYHAVMEDGTMALRANHVSTVDTFREIDYTEDALAFLEETKQLLDALSTRASEFFNREDFAQLMVPGSRLLAGPSNKIEV